MYNSSDPCPPQSDSGEVTKSAEEISSVHINQGPLSETSAIAESTEALSSVHINQGTLFETGEIAESTEELSSVHMNQGTLFETGEIAESTEEGISSVYVSQGLLAETGAIAESTEELSSVYVNQGSLFETGEIAESTEELSSVHINQGTLSETGEIAESTVEISPVFVDLSYLPSVSEFSKSRFYLDDNLEFGTVISKSNNAQTFYDTALRLNETSTPFEEPDDGDDLIQYELYTETMEKHADMPVDEDRPYDIHSVQTVRKGLIINSEMYLTNDQWNTIVLDKSKDKKYCAVCGKYPETEDHVNLVSHVEQLAMHKPLYKYDWSIARKILDHIHCAVCNMLFPEIDSDIHFSSENHSGYILYFINKASDMFDSKIDSENPDSYHFNASAINNNNTDFNTSNNIASNSNNYINYGNNYYGDTYEAEYEVEDIEDDFGEIPPLNLEHSYASMAKRPKEDLPEVLEIDFANKKVTVNYNFWNMIRILQDNRFYCMVCKEFGPARRKAEHCRSVSHMERLNRCKNVDSYGMHLVRQVDDRLYHCGHCNNLHLINEMAAHIRRRHTGSPSTSLKDSKSTDREPTKNKPLIKFENETFSAPGNIPLAPRNNMLMFKDLLLANSNDDDIVICAYGKAIRITKMAFNIVCVKDNELYCGLCEANVEKAFMIEHISNMHHLVLLRSAPFLQTFNVHLFRQIRQALHCALCNLLVPVDNNMIASHKYNEMHINRYREAITPINQDTSKDIKPAPIIDNKKSSREAIQPVTSQETSTETKPANIDNKNHTAKTIDNKTTIKEPTCVDNTADLYEKVKNGVRIPETESDESDIDEFAFDEEVYVKLGNSYSKITNTSYNSLVPVGDGSRYCFVCEAAIDRDVQKHVNSRGHSDNLKNCMFLENFKEELLRQLFLTYHCSVCNVLVTKKQLDDHLSWPMHAEQAETTRMSGKQRKADLKSGMKLYELGTAKEFTYLNVAEKKLKVYINVAMQNKQIHVKKKSKIVIYDDIVHKIGFEAWHSVSKGDKGWKCILCQCEFGRESIELGNHVASDWHKANLEKFDMEYLSSFMRKINDTTMNCVICNTEVSKNLVPEHILGRIHKKAYQTILEEGIITNNYSDCDENALTLEKRV